MKWVPLGVALCVHDRQISEHGGAFGLRDMGLLESGLTRAKQRACHDKRADVCDLGAEYAFGIARDHPFIDGNKRTAYVTTRLFLRLNNKDMGGAPSERVLMFVGLAKGTCGLNEFAAWLRGPRSQ